jgi:hypothetical protein
LRKGSRPPAKSKDCASQVSFGNSKAHFFVLAAIMAVLVAQTHGEIIQGGYGGLPSSFG